MNARRRLIAVAAVCLAALPLVSCGGLPRALRNRIAAEKQNLAQAEQQWKRSQQTVQDDLTHSPDLFAGTPVLTRWPEQLQAARATLERAKSDLVQLGKLEKSRGSREDVQRAEALLGEERALRQSAVREAESVESDANSWLDFARNLPHYLATMQREHDDIRSANLMPVSDAVGKADRDWPAKKAVLDGRLASLQQLPQEAEVQWQATQMERQDAAAGKATGAETAKLIEANDVLQRDDNALTHGAEQLQADCGQLYTSWDKILADLDVTHRGPDTVYAEKITTVRTHFVDLGAKKTEVSTNTQWTDVPASSFRAVRNDLGMVIAHKDVGQFDSEAQTQPQPPGFAYIAPPSQGSNQYGYWSNEGGRSVWTWLPQYLLLRELLWGHNYRPIVIDEYHGYEMARRAGRTWYGQESPASPPKYGSHGTFTTQRYASSRYVQSGGFAGSSYSSSRSAGTGARPEPRFGESDSGTAGKRFGGSSNGQRFGSGGNGQRFGSPRSMPRMPGRRFGGRR